MTPLEWRVSWDRSGGFVVGQLLKWVDRPRVENRGVLDLGALVVLRARPSNGVTSLRRQATGTPYGHALPLYDPGEDLPALVRRLLRQAAGNISSPRSLLFLGRSFWSTDVVRYRQRARYPFLMPLQARGRKSGTPDGRL
jgi:hypothetical protein